MPSSTAVAGDLGQMNLTDPATFVDPGIADVWRRLRREQPVYLHPATGEGPEFWVLTRYADVLSVYKDPARFSSQRGNMLTSLLAGGDAAGGKLLAVTDPPRHTAVRMMLLKSFSPRVLRLVADGVRARTEKLVTAAVAAGTCDFATDVAEQVPMGTICDLLGVPESDQAELLRLSKRSLSADEPDQTDEATRLARNEILLYFADLAQHRRAEPRDDVVSALATCRIEGEPLTEEEVVLNCYGLVLAGDETSRLAMIGAVVNFTRYPEQWEALREDRVALADAVEEILRWTTPAMHLGRTAQTDVTVRGRTIRAGDLVTGWNVSANRDEAVFADPEVFDLGRTPNKHLTFGYGPHFCLGSYLGRAEVAAMVDSLRRKVARIELRGEPKPLYSTFLRGYSSVPVRLESGEG